MIDLRTHLFDAASCTIGAEHKRMHPVTPPKKVAKPKTAAERKARLDRILAELDKLYPNAVCALHHKNAWELLVATILSAQCTDERVNKVTPGLFKKYPTVAAMAAAKQEDLALDIRSTGFFNNKARSLIGAATKLMADHKGKVPNTIEELLKVPGAARKTSNVVLGVAYGIASGVVVDTHVQRITQRLDLTKNEEPVKIEQDLMKLLPQESLDSVLAPGDSFRPRHLHRAQTEVRGVSARPALLFRRQGAGLGCEHDATISRHRRRPIQHQSIASGRDGQSRRTRPRWSVQSCGLTRRTRQVSECCGRLPAAGLP